MEYIQSIFQTPIMTHSKYYSPDNDYRSMYPFLIEEKTALPLSLEFWDMIMGQAASWGVTTFEQDWLESIFELMEKPSWVCTINSSGLF